MPAPSPPPSAPPAEAPQTAGPDTAAPGATTPQGTARPSPRAGGHRTRALNDARPGGETAATVQAIATFPIDTLTTEQALQAQALIAQILSDPGALSSDARAILRSQQGALQRHLARP
ncbi:MAG: hypothetical protein JJU19_13195 [Pararhodobacter sp.]|nr:hypothetical protein [Pararhodobacter sp.]